MEAIVYNKEGKESGKVKLPKEIFELPWNADLVHQVITSMMTAKRTPFAHTKDRSEVAGGGKKPWRQKGTGRARHGSIRSPIWKGGGVTHGPRNDKNFDRKINKKMKTKALYTLLSKKVKDGEVLFVDGFSYEKPQTKEAKAFFDSFEKVKGFEEIKTKKKNKALISTASRDENVVKSFSNFNNIKLDEIRNMNPVDVANYKYIVIENPEESLKTLTGRMK